MTNACQSHVWPELHPNGTIGCGDLAHSVNEAVPKGLSRDDRIHWIADHAPPLTAEQISKLMVLLFPDGQSLIRLLRRQDNLSALGPVR